MKDAKVFTELLEIVKQNKQEKTSYPHFYHLSNVRTNLVSWLPIKCDMRVLECNAECGALTGTLLAMAKEVVSVTECQEQADIILERYKIEAERLTVLTGELPVSGNFDVILLVGDVWRFAGRMKKFCSLLKPDGRLFLADANRIGTKYLAGCQDEYQGGYFTGVEGYLAADMPQTDSLHQGHSIKRCYTRKEYIGMLEQAGFLATQVYYPYPDYKFPSSIYSDQWLPKEGDLSDNRRNFEHDRLLLFEERSVFDTLLKEGLFGEFSNSFLIEAKIEGTVGFQYSEKPVYVKYSDERAGLFAIRTEIVQDLQSGRRVYKYALDKEGTSHILHIQQAYEGLKNAYRDSSICFCPCDSEQLQVSDGIYAEGNVWHKETQAWNGVCVGSETSKEVVGEAGAQAGSRMCMESGRKEKKEGQRNKIRVAFPFIKGITLQDVLEKAVSSNDMETVEHIIREYIRRMKTFGGSTAFCMTREFEETFGRQELEETYPCADISDIDIIFSNILVSEDAADRAWEKDIKWNVIDYEWTFAFPVPKDFVIYRAMHFAYYQILNDTGWTLQMLYEMAGITQKQVQMFAAMEENFQDYLGKDVLPVRNMQRLFGTKIWKISDLMTNEEKTKLSGGTFFGKKERIKVKRIYYHIDRQDYQDGSFICCGWAFAMTKDGKNIPVEIQVTDAAGKKIDAEIHRLPRKDVAQVLKISSRVPPMWGFDCVWLAPPERNWQIRFSLGNHRTVVSALGEEIDSGKMKFRHLR